MTEIVAIDFRGSEIRAGDTVLYPRASGRSVEMTEAKVLDVIEDPKGRQIGNPAWDDWRDRRIAETPEGEYWFKQLAPVGDPQPEHFLTVPAWKFRLMPTRSTRFTRWSDKSVLIQIGENVVRIEATA